MTKVILYYTDNISVSEGLAKAVRKQLLKANLPIISVSQSPMNFGKNVCIGPIGRSRISMTKQVLLGLDSTNANVIFIVEHDVLYHPSYFKFRPTEINTLYFNQNLWHVRSEDGANFQERHNGAISQLVGYKWGLRSRFMERLDNFVTKAPLLRMQGYDWYRGKNLPEISPWCKFEGWTSAVPSLDIRHGGNLTGKRKFNIDKSQIIPGWGDPRNRFKDFIKGAVDNA